MWGLLRDQLVAPRAAWASPLHPNRNSSLEEARCVHLLGLADGRAVAQARAYLGEGFAHAGGGLDMMMWVVPSR